MSTQKTIAAEIAQQPPAPPVAPVPAPVAEEEPPPFLGTWRNVYTLVIAELLVLVVLFYALTRWVS